MSVTTDTAPAEAAGERRPSALAPLGLRDFRLLCVTQLATGLRSSLLWVSQIWYVTLVAPEDQQLLVLGLFATLRGITFLLYIVFGGAFADRYPRRTTLVVAHTLAFAVVVLTGALLLLPSAAEGGGAWLWLMLALFATAEVIYAQDLPTRTAMIADIVPASMFTSAVNLFEMQLAISFLAGSAVAGLAIDGLGFGVTYMLAGLGHVAVIAIVLWMRAGGTAADPDAAHESVVQNVRGGIGYLRDDPVVRWIVLATWIVSALGLSVLGALNGAFARDVLDMDATTFGILIVFWGVGGVVASGALMLRAEYGHKGLIFLGSTVMLGVGVLGLGLSREALPAFLFLGLIGGTYQVFRIVGIAAVENIVPNRLLGRVMALLLLAMGVSHTVGLAVGAIGQSVGLTVIYPAAGLAVLFFALAIGAAQKPLRTLD